MPKRILLLTQWFDPEPTFKGLLFAKELLKRGFEVEVVTGFPNYPGGRVYDGYKIQWRHQEWIEGVLVTRLALYPSHDSSAKKRILNYLSFAVTSFFYCLFSAKKADVMYAYHPPLTIGIVASIVRIFRKIPVVYDIQDIWPDTLRATGMVNNEKVLGLVDNVARWVYRHVDHLVVLSPGFKRLLLERTVSDAKVTVIPNWCDESSLTKRNTEVHKDFPADSKFKIVFAGNMGKAQALDIVIEAAVRLRMTHPQVVFIMIGTGIEADRLKSKTLEQELTNVIFLPAMPMDVIGNYLEMAEALLVHLRDDALFEITIPSKTQAYLYMGKPVLMGVRGDAADIIDTAGAGIVFEPGNVDSLCQAIGNLFEQSTDVRLRMGSAGRNYYDEHLSLLVGVNAFAKLFDSLSTDRSPK